jgi:uncharacterized protein (DUF983 family)
MESPVAMARMPIFLLATTPSGPMAVFGSDHRCGLWRERFIPNKTVQRIGASRVAQRQIIRQRRLAPVADLIVSHMRRCTYCGKEYDDMQTVCVADQQPTAQVPSVAKDTAVGPFLAEASRRRNNFFLWWLCWVPVGSAATMLSILAFGSKGGYSAILWFVLWGVGWHRIKLRLRTLACPRCGKPAFAHAYFLIRHARCNSCGTPYAQEG